MKNININIIFFLFFFLLQPISHGKDLPQCSEEEKGNPKTIDKLIIQVKKADDVIKAGEEKNAVNEKDRHRARLDQLINESINEINEKTYKLIDTIKKYKKNSIQEASINQKKREDEEMQKEKEVNLALIDKSIKHLQDKIESQQNEDNKLKALMLENKKEWEVLKEKERVAMMKAIDNRITVLQEEGQSLDKEVKENEQRRKEEDTQHRERLMEIVNQGIKTLQEKQAK